ncbi:MAG: tRNA uridine-5-carboxymethylaminomethyl(34) synthesis enzyme MnmG [Erysipelotrichaceae bacterium]|nr:tRNA uridine-5-carboxymethylaminomethyl(34) synthesis enzyme MnmG [Erysipelotrichaceae bacterium]
MKEYEVIVVGGGHAGCEAALSTARIGHKTLLVTGNINNVATMPCNPSIGGSAKGIIVREIDALGGEMGRNADKTLIQMKMLNSSKGPSVHSLRAQADKITYPKEMLKTLKSQENLTLQEGMVEDLIVEDNTVKGIVLADGTKISSSAVILTTGTYLKADILRGSTRTRSGPHGEKPSMHLSDNLKKYGFKILRLKTGTPPRIARDSIDFSKTKREDGDPTPYTFSHDFSPIYDVNHQEPCYLVYTNQNTHKIILDNLSKSSMYGGLNDIEGVGPRYCPSIEDKITRFKDKEKHQLFLEPESLYYDDIYLQGFSTSMPEDIQEKMVHSLEGLEHAKILKYAYAIEYDAIYPTQINASLETKLIKNLFTAGQINGTSGYEEAACQGLMAGINAALKLENKEPLILKRNEAYIGVLIDDLVTKGTMEPYRMLTSRAEYRLLLRHDNCDIRLREYGHQVGLIDEERYQKFQKKLSDIEALKEQLKTIKLTPTKEINQKLEKLNSMPLKDGITLYDLLRRTEINIQGLKKEQLYQLDYSTDVEKQVEIQIKYEGYIQKIEREAQKMLKNESKQIPKDIDYSKVKNLASEARQKLETIRPTSIGQATRISGVNPADISILMIYLRKNYNE